MGVPGRMMPMLVLCLPLLLCPPAGATDLVMTYRLALQNDPDFRIAEANLMAGLQAAPRNRAALLPQVNLSINSTDTDRNSGGENNSYRRDVATLTATLPLVNAPAWYRASAGNLQAQAAKSTYRQTRQTLVLKVARHYLEVLRAQDELESAKALRLNSRQQVEQVKLRYSAGLTNVNDLEEARYGLDNARAVYLGADSNLATARLALSALTNRPVNGIHQLNKAFTEWPPDMSPSDLVALALRSNFALQALRLRSSSARALAQGAASQHLPTLNLNLARSESETDQYNNLPAAFGSVLPSKSEDTTLSVSLNLPLYSGGGINARKRQAKAEYESLRQGVLLAERNLRQEMLALHSRIVSSVATIKANRQALKSALSAEEATRIRYSAGTRNTLDVSTASRLTHDARRRYQDGLYNHILLRLQLEEAIGDLNLDDLKMVNAWLLPPTP